MHHSRPDGTKIGNAVVERLEPDKFKVTINTADVDGKVAKGPVEVPRKK